VSPLAPRASPLFVRLWGWIHLFFPRWFWEDEEPSSPARPSVEVAFFERRIGGQLLDPTSMLASPLRRESTFLCLLLLSWCEDGFHLRSSGLGFLGSSDECLESPRPLFLPPARPESSSKGRLSALLWVPSFGSHMVFLRRDSFIQTAYYSGALIQSVLGPLPSAEYFFRIGDPQKLFFHDFFSD